MPQPAPLRPGDPTSLGGYTLIGRLGVGGQGVVYLGLDRAEAPVAVKVLHADLASDESMLAQFLREVVAAKQVARFCTAQIVDVDVDGDRPYVVSEYVDGPSLAVQVVRGGPRYGASLERLAIGMATALTAIHQAGIIHRDFKPGNVLIGPDGPRVIDFGISRALDMSMSLSGGRPIGTPAYMAPEQFRAQRIGPSQDIFSFGGTLVYAATGRPPFGADTLAAIMHRVLTTPPDLGEMSGQLRDLAVACLAKDQGDRPDAREILLSLLGAVAPSEGAAEAVLIRGRIVAGADVPLDTGGQEAARGPESAVRAPGPMAGAWSEEELTDLSLATGPRDWQTDPGAPDRSARDLTDPGAHALAAREFTDPDAAAAMAQKVTEPGVPARPGIPDRRTRNGMVAGAVTAAIVLVLVGATALVDGTGHGASPGTRKSSVPQAAKISPDSRSVYPKQSIPLGTSTGAPQSNVTAPQGTPTGPGWTATAQPMPGTTATPSATATATTVGTLSAEDQSLTLTKGWTTTTDRIAAVGGPVQWSASAGVHLRVSPSSGSLAAGGQVTLVIDHTDNSGKGSSTIVIAAERTSVTITVTWTK